MKRIPCLVFGGAYLLTLFAGCAKKAGPASPPTPPRMQKEAVSPAPLPPPTPETVVERLTQAKDPDILPHKIDDKTEFPESLASLAPEAKPPTVVPPPSEIVVKEVKGKDAPPEHVRPPSKGLTSDGSTSELLMKDWTGIVLVPVDITKVAKAHTVRVTLNRIETHPLATGQVRVWTRIKNIDPEADLSAEVACSFRTVEKSDEDQAKFYKLIIPRRDFSDVFFVSPAGMNLNEYTILIRAENMVWSGTYRE